MSNLHSNDVHIGIGVDLPFASAHAEVTIDRTPIGVGPDARCAMLVSVFSLGALVGLAQGVSVVRKTPRAIRTLLSALRDDETLRAFVTKTAERARVVVSAEIDDIVSNVTRQADAGG